MPTGVHPWAISFGVAHGYMHKDSYSWPVFDVTGLHYVHHVDIQGGEG
jgi:hypothetical protein